MKIKNLKETKRTSIMRKIFIFFFIIIIIGIKGVVAEPMIINGELVEAISIAYEQISKNSIDMSKIEVSIDEDVNFFYITFFNKPDPNGAVRGNLGGIRETKYKISKTTFQIITTTYGK